MSSYLEKLKKGMDLEETIEVPEETIELVSENIIETEEGIQIEEVKEESIKEITEEIIEESKKKIPSKKKTVIKKKPKTKKKTIPKKEESEEEPFTEVVFGNPKSLEKEKETILTSLKKDDKWLKPEGELTVDIYQTEKHIIIRSVIAGIKMSDINIVLEGDILIIKGERKRPKDTEEIKTCFSQECHWGLFSKKIILPVSIDEENIEATMKNGILELKMRIINSSGQKEIKIRRA